MTYTRLLVHGIILSVVAILLYHFMVSRSAVVDLQVHTDNRTLFKIYYKSVDNHWNERRSETVLIQPGVSEYRVRIADISRVSAIRIDTSEKPAIVTVKSMVFSQPGFRPVHIDSPSHFERLQVEGGVADFGFSEQGFTVKPASKDPRLVYPFPALEKEDIGVAQTIRYLLLICTSFFMVFLFNRGLIAWGNNYHVVLAGIVVLVLISVMASISIYNAHPDEKVHVLAADFFKDHFFPPEIGSPEMSGTYSPYGVSRLASGEIAYFVAGKFAKVLEPLQLEPFHAMRIFNVFLFGSLLVLAFLIPAFRLIFIPLLLSPQIWYIFSYFNGEAFGMVVILLVAYQLAVEDSAWNRLLSEKELSIGVWQKLGWLLGLGLLLGAMFLLKKNFYFFIIFVGLYCFWRLLFRKTSLTRQNLLRIAVVFLVGACFAGSIRFTEHYLNDFKRAEKILEARETYAQRMYKPSTPLNKKFPQMYLRERGVGLDELIHKAKWGERNFRSSFGEYGYTSVAASFTYYNVVRYSCLALAALVLCITLARGRLEGTALLGIVIVCGLALMAMALYRCWTVDFQSQGRYLLPIVGMLSVFLYHMREKINLIPCTYLAGWLYFVGLYSFIFVALAGILKITAAMG